jgi:hypothetical protein
MSSAQISEMSPAQILGVANEIFEILFCLGVSPVQNLAILRDFASEFFEKCGYRQ